MCNLRSAFDHRLPRYRSCLNDLKDPAIGVVVVPFCGKPECEMAVRQQTGAWIESINKSQEVKQTGASGGPSSVKAGATATCRVCDKSEGAKFCQGCKLVAYCGKEHQKKDWSAHKQVCRSSTNANTSS